MRSESRISTLGTTPPYLIIRSDLASSVRWPDIKETLPKKPNMVKPA